MMNDVNPTPEQVRESIIPKSDQLNADDLITGPITVTIEKVRRGDKEQPIIVDITGHRPYKPCKSMRRILIAAFSDDPKQWVGQRMTLFSDPEVTWGGVKVGGIRISHLSGLEKQKTFLITQARGRRSEVTIYPIVVSDDASQIEKAKAAIRNAATLDELKAVASTIKKASKAVQDAVRAAYAQRQSELQTLDTWKKEIAALDTRERCAEFRRELLPQCPTDIADTVDKLLTEHANKLAV